ncbi:hypothetical protein PSGK_18155 [Pseudomonas solani]|uniref:hypothetical protein n=1 Tax=Pseudomonas solani TaxID=2731552 RepID=UPI0035BE2862
MTRAIALLAALLSCLPAWSSNDHLDPNEQADRSVALEQARRYVFRQAFEEGTLFNTILSPALSLESVAGVAKHGTVTEAFVLIPSTDIRFSLRLQKYEAEKDASRRAMLISTPGLYEQVRATTPTNYREIKTTRIARPLTETRAQALSDIWREELAGTRPESDSNLTLDGYSMYFFMPSPSGEWLSGTLSSPGEGSRMEALGRLGWELRQYAEGKITEQELDQRIAAYQERYLKP